MSVGNLFAVAGLSLLGLVMIGRLLRKFRLRSFVAITCVSLGVAFLAAGLCLENWNRAKARSAAPELASIQNREPQVTEKHELFARTAGKTAHVDVSYFAGSWKNADSKTPGLTALRVRTEGQSVWIHAWEKCHPTDCDWGEVSGTAVSPISTELSNQTQKVTATFETSFSNTRLTLSPVDDDEIEADTQTRFTDNSGRSGYAATYTFRH